MIQLPIIKSLEYKSSQVRKINYIKNMTDSSSKIMERLFQSVPTQDSIFNTSDAKIKTFCEKIILPEDHN